MQKTPYNQSPKPTPGSAVAQRGNVRGGAACLNRYVFQTEGE